MSYTSNGRFAVDREFEYMELVSRRGLGELFGPPGELFGPPGELFGPPWGALWAPGGGSENFINFCENACFIF